MQKLLDQVKEKENELHKISTEGNTALLEKDFELKLQNERIRYKEDFDGEKKDLIAKYEAMLKDKEKEHKMEIEEKIKAEKNKEAEKAEKAREEERRIAEKEKKEEMQKLLDQVKEKENELHKISTEGNTALLEKDFELKLQNERIRYKEDFDAEKKNLIETYEALLKDKEKEHKMEIDEKVKAEKNKEAEKNHEVQQLLDQIRGLKEARKEDEISKEAYKKYEAEKEKNLQEHKDEMKRKDDEVAKMQEKHNDEIKSWEAIVKDKEAELKAIKDEKLKEKQQKIQQEKEEREKEEKRAREKENVDLKQKVKANKIEKELSQQEFHETYPALFSEKTGKTPSFELFKNATEHDNRKRFEEKINIKLRKEDDLKNRQGGNAARFFVTQYPKHLKSEGDESWINKGSKMIFGDKPRKQEEKVLMLLGLTGSGKTTFVDALVNYVFDTRYADEFRLKLIRMTREESAKSDHQAVSQTDNIVVYKVKHLPGMKIDYDLTIIDTPGFGDTRGVNYDKRLMQNIEVLFHSKKITHLDAIGFVARAGDARLTAQQNYIFESILHIFGNDVKDNLVSILTNYDGQTVNILDSFREADMDFVENFPVNSAAVFQTRVDPVDSDIMKKYPKVAQYQEFFNTAKQITDVIRDLKPKKLDQTLKVLDDRERIQVELQGVQERIMELLGQKDTIQMETDICNQHAANAEANKDSEYEVEEQKMEKVQLEVGTYVTNCLNCNRTCHYPCSFSNDSDKKWCAAMRGENCTVCPKKCHWKHHVNNQYRIEFKVEKVKKTYQELVERHNDFISKHKGQKTVIDALQAEADAASREIQASVPIISNCLASLKENALRPNMSSSADYLDQMISAEEHDRKPDFQKRIKQLRIEQDKARMINAVQEGRDIMDAKK